MARTNLMGSMWVWATSSECRGQGRPRPARTIFLVLICIGASFAMNASARGVYQTAEDFIAGAFEGSPPRAAVLWLTRKIKPGVREILGHDYPSLRVRYWLRDGRSAWVLEEIGKERPITLGVVVDEGRVAQVRVLTYRESRGSEVRRPFFTRQFLGAVLDRHLSLDRDIDGISGATLSVRAVKKLVRLALYLHMQVAGQ